MRSARKPQFWQVTCRVPATRVQRKTTRRFSGQSAQVARAGSSVPRHSRR
jgi:hypothetical protein